MAKKIADIRRPEIVKSLFKAIQKNGVALPGYDQVAREGGMTRQLIRHYFKDPDDLALALCNYLADLYREKLLAGIISAEKSERLSIFLDFYFAQLEDPRMLKPEDDQVYDALMARAGVDPRVKKNLHSQYELLQMTVAHEIKISHPDLPHNGCRDLGFLMVSQMYGHWKMVASLGFDATYNKVARDAMDRLIESYLARYEDPDA